MIKNKIKNYVRACVKEELKKPKPSTKSVASTAKPAKKDRSVAVLEYENRIIIRNINGLMKIMFDSSLHDYIDIHKGKRCFIMGNGPSLNQIDLSKMKNEIKFGSNKVYLGFDKWGFNVDYWMCQDRILLEKYADPIYEALDEDIVKFVPLTLIPYFDQKYIKNIVPVFMNYAKQLTFSNNAYELHEGHTVTLGLMQIAVIMGFTDIVLVGVDHNYVIPKENITEDNKWHGKGIHNHFTDEYTNFEQGQVWEMPNFDKMNKAYENAAKFAENNGVSIRNATPGSKLTAFPMVDYDSLF